MKTNNGHILVGTDHQTSFPLVRVTFFDSETFDEWTAVDDLDEGPLPLITSVGYMVADTEDFVIIAADLDAKNGTCARRMKIPHPVIKDIKTL